MNVVLVVCNVPGASHDHEAPGVEKTSEREGSGHGAAAVLGPGSAQR